MPLVLPSLTCLTLFTFSFSHFSSLSEYFSSSIQYCLVRSDTLFTLPFVLRGKKEKEEKERVVDPVWRQARLMKEGGGRKHGAASPCAACKLLRRRCAQDCVFAPYFPADEPQKFANVHKVFGASNVNKMLQDLPMHQRGDAVSSMVYEANARIRDPVYGCVGAISSLQQQIDVLQTQLALAQAEVLHLRVRQTRCFSNPGLSPTNSGSPSSKIMDSQPKPIFDMDHASYGDSMWS